MSEKNEGVVIEMLTIDRIRLSEQIYKRMQELGLKPYDYESLDLGFDLPITWPADKDSELLLSTVVVVARKLKMRIIIGKIELEPLKS